MLSTVFRIAFKPEAEKHQIADFVAKLSVKPACQWEKGGERLGGLINKTSGCNVGISDSEDLDEILVDIRNFLMANPFLRHSDTKDIVSGESEIDLGLTVGGKVHFARSAIFPSEFLAEVASFGVTLSVSCYPCSDEDEDESGTPAVIE